MTFDIEPVTPEEIGTQAQSKWEALYASIEAAARSGNGGIFVTPFEKRDAQNLSQSIRKQTRVSGLRLRWKQAGRNGREGFFLWLERDTRAKPEEVA